MLYSLTFSLRILHRALVTVGIIYNDNNLKFLILMQCNAVQCKRLVDATIALMNTNHAGEFT